MSSVPPAIELLHSWNGQPEPRLAQIRIEDDTLRDGLQGAFVRIPTLDQKKELLRLSVRAGCQQHMLGFPAASPREFEDCAELVRFLDAEGLETATRFLARALESDLEPIVRLNDGAKRDVWADFFINTSPLRRAIEGWSFEQLLEKTDRASVYCLERGVPFGISIEDATRSRPADIEAVLRIAVTGGAKTVFLCDTTGAASPDGAARLVAFTRDYLATHGKSDIEIGWHGHNDRGMALSASLAAAVAGADVVGGAFLGIGERSGNMAIEQLASVLAEAGNSAFVLETMTRYCEKLSAYAEIPIHRTAPIVGDQAFATCTGTHAAAVLKARSLGRDYEDLVFSAIRAQQWGKKQVVMLGPTSGRANAKHALVELGLPSSDDDAERLLRHAKQLDRWLEPADVRAFSKSSPTGAAEAVAT